MLEWTKEFLTGPAVPVVLILLFTFGNTFLENIFPPAPCDTVLLFTGTLIGLGRVDFFTLLIFSTLGSAAGFALMFALGRMFGDRIIESGRFKFINRESLRRPEKWFEKYGYIIIVVNRFLSGTRSVISFFAGASKLRAGTTILLATISSLVWNAGLLLLGMILGENWESANVYMSEYGRIVLIVVSALIVIYIVYKLIARKKAGSQA